MSTSFKKRETQEVSRRSRAVMGGYPRGGGVVLRISSDGDDRRIFLALKSAILGFFWAGKFGIVLGGLI